MSFKIGDKIEAWDASKGSASIHNGGVYEVAHVDGKYLDLAMGDEGKSVKGIFAKRFKLTAASAAPQATSNLSNAFKYGDVIICVSTDGPNRGQYTIGKTYVVTGVVAGSGNARIIGDHTFEWIVTNSDFELAVTSGGMVMGDGSANRPAGASSSYCHNLATTKSYRPKETANAEVDNLKQYRYTPERF